MISEGLSGSPLAAVISRKMAKQFVALGPGAIAESLSPFRYDAPQMRDDLVVAAKGVLASATYDVLNSACPDEKGLTLGVFEPSHTSLVEALEGPVSSGIHDLIAIALSIPTMSQTEALAIALSAGSQAAVNRYGMTGERYRLRFPAGTGNLPPLGPDYKGDIRISYSPKIGRIVCRKRSKSEGCPVARGRVHLLESFYGTVAQVAIKNVTLKDGTKYYSTD